MKRRLRRGLRIAYVESVSHDRRQREHPWRTVLELFLVVFAALVVVGRLPVGGDAAPYPDAGAYHYARTVVETPGAAAAVRGFAGILFVLVALVAMLWTVKGQGWREHADGLLTTVPIGTIVAGDALATAIKATRFLSLAIVGGAAAFAAGSGRPAGAVGVVVAAAGLIATAAALGYVGGLAALAALRRSAFVREHRLLVGAPLAALYFGLFAASRRAGAVLGGLPIAWYGDVALASIGAGDPRLAAAALVATPIALGGLWAVATALARRAWLADPPREAARTSPSGGSVRSAEAPDVVDRVLAATCARPTRTVVRTVWRRVVREPQGLLYVVLPLVLLATVGYELARAIPAALPALVAVYGAGAVGAGATLNPLGNEGRGLPATLTAPDSARHVVRGYLVSAALPGALAVGAATVAAAAADAASPPVLLGAGAFAAALTASLVAISLGVGAVLPEFDALRPSESAGVIAPHVYAVAVYSAAIAAVSAPVLAAAALAGEGATGLSAGTLVALGALGTLGAAALAGALSYRYAVRTFEEFLIAA